MIIKEYKPCRALNDYIKSFIIIEDTDGIIRNKWMSIYPSGHPEMILSYGDKVIFSKDDHVLNDAEGYLGGQSIEPNFYKCFGSLKIVSVILKPWGIYRLLGIDQDQFTNYTIDLKFIFGEEGSDVLYRLCETPDLRSKIDLIESYFLKLLRDMKQNPDPDMMAASLIEHTIGKVSLEDLSFIFNKSVKTIERTFKKSIGITPKTFSRIIRFNNVLNDLSSLNDIKIQDIVHKYGYYDQSHLINDFKKFTSLTPSSFLNKDSNIVFSFRELIQI